MSYNVFKDTNDNLITAPNESGEIVLDTSISTQIRIEVNHNEYSFYDIIKKEYLSLSEIRALDPKLCHFTAIIYPCSSALDPSVDLSLTVNEANYPIVYKFADVCLGSRLSSSHITRGKYYSNNISYNSNPSISNPTPTISIEFEFHFNVTDENSNETDEYVNIRLNLSTLSFTITSDDVEIISLFQHNITINARLDISNRINTRYLYSFSFSFINNRYEQYDKSGLTTQTRLLSMIEDLPQNKRYPASGLLYLGSYSGGSSTMSMLVCYTINYVNKSGSNLNVHALDTDMNMNAAPTSIINIYDITQTIVPHGMTTLTFVDDVIKLS